MAWEDIEDGELYSSIRNKLNESVYSLIEPIKEDTNKIDRVHNSSDTFPNRDGNLFERTEFIIANLLNQLPVKTYQSDSLSPATDIAVRFFVNIFDINGNAFPENEIILTNASIVLEQSCGGMPFTIVDIPQPTLTKGNGFIATSFIFASPIWEETCTYKLTISGVEIHDGVDFNLQTFTWSNLITAISDIESATQAILTAVEAPINNSTETTTMAQTIGRKADTANSNPTSSVMNMLRNILTSQPCRRFKALSITDTTHFVTDSAFTAADNTFTGWYVMVYQSATATIGEFRQILNYVKTGGIVTHTAFSNQLSDGDSVYFIHPMLYNSYLVKIETDKISSLIEAIDNIKTESDKISSLVIKLDKPLADSTDDHTISEVIGTKSDALSTVVGTTKSLISYIKGILTNLNLVKTETDKMPATIVKIDTINTNTTPKTQKVFPTLANGVTVTSGAIWTLGNFIEVIPVNTIASTFQITGIDISYMSADATYELVLYRGLLGSEVEIGRARFTRISNTYSIGLHVPIDTTIIASNTRISAKVAASSANRNTIINIIYKI